jgi:hypothetical protein
LYSENKLRIMFPRAAATIGSTSNLADNQRKSNETWFDARRGVANLCLSFHTDDACFPKEQELCVRTTTNASKAKYFDIRTAA